MKFIVAAILLFTPALGFAGQSLSDKPITIAVIDSGFGFHGIGMGAKLCKYGHKDFSGIQKFDKTLHTVDPVPIDNVGHGTNVVGLIEDYASKSHANFCIVVLKYWDPLDKVVDRSIASNKAIKYANEIHVDMINYSGGGKEFNPLEAIHVTKFLSEGGIFVAAAGNDRHQLNGETKYKYFPAMIDPRIIVVGSKRAEAVDNMYEKGGELEGANWNVVEEMPKMRENFDKHGFFVVKVTRIEKDVLDMDVLSEMGIPGMGAISYYKVLIKQGSEVFMKSDASNFGKPIKRWEVGETQTAYGITLSGTSQATAIATGKIVGELYKKFIRLEAR